MWELSRIKRQPLISDIPKGEIGSAQKRKKRRRGNAACSEREIDRVVSTNILSGGPNINMDKIYNKLGI